MKTFEILVDDAQRHALVTAVNAWLAQTTMTSADTTMVESMEELAGMLADAQPDGVLNDFTV